MAQLTSPRPRRIPHAPGTRTQSDSDHRSSGRRLRSTHATLFPSAEEKWIEWVRRTQRRVTNGYRLRSLRSLRGAPGSAFARMEAGATLRQTGTFALTGVCRATATLNVSRQAEPGWVGVSEG